MPFTVFAKAIPRENPGGAGVDGPGGSRLEFWRCKRRWGISGSTHEGLSAHDVAVIRAEPSLTDILVFEEGSIDVDLSWDDEID